MKYMRNVILYIFKRSFCNNELEYRTVLDVVFKGKVPQSFRNCPSFSEKGLEDTLFDHFLTKDGLLAIFTRSSSPLTFSPSIGPQTDSLGPEGHLLFP